MTNDTVLNAMILEIGSKFKGRAHSGLDDARNIARIVQQLLEDGASLIFNEKLPEKSANNNNDKWLFALPVLQSEFGSIKANFPSKHCPTNAMEKTQVKENSTTSGLVKTLAKETPAKTCAEEDKIKISAKENPTKTNPKKTAAQAASEQTQGKKNEAKKSPSITASKNAGKKSRKQHPVKVCPAQTAVKEINGNSLAKISGTSNHEKTAEVLAKELKLAKKEFYRKVQPGNLTKELRVAQKNMEVLKKCLNAARSNEAACVSKPPIEDEATARITNVAKEQQVIGASGKTACDSQKMAKKKVSSGKKGKQSESKESLGIVLHDMKPLPQVGTTASFCVQDVNLITTKELLFDKAAEEMLFLRFKMVLNTRTISDREGKEDN